MATMRWAFLTAGFLGMVYYFVPKRANRPIYSYRLSIVHFWSLIFVIFGWSSPPSLHSIARLGADPWYVFDYALDAELGWYDVV